MNQATTTKRLWALSVMAAATALGLSGCGGGGGGAAEVLPPSPVGLSSGEFAQRCAPTNPYLADSDVGPSPRTESLDMEKRWVREYLSEAYLWYQQMPTVDASAAAYSSVSNVPQALDNYLHALSNTANDRSSLTLPTKALKAWTQSGTRLSYGAQLIQASATPPRVPRLAYVAAGTAAASAGLRRGDTVVMVDGVSVDTTTAQGIAIVNEALNPTSAGSHRWVVSRQGVQQPEVTLVASQVTFNPVPVVRVHTVGTSKVGYLLFNDHVLTAEAALIDAMASFKSQGVNDLVVDLRYNGGGYTYLASQLAFMIAGDVPTFNKRFEQREYSDKRWMDSARSDATVGFFGTSCFYNASLLCTNRTPLPTLDLRRVWVLAGKGTCATSEAFVSALRGVDVDVRLIGGATCGQPYGVQGKDNCGITVLPVAYRGLNHKGESIGNSGYAPTCPAADDLTRELGDLNEGLLTAALYNRGNNNACSIAAAQAKAAAPDATPIGQLSRALRLSTP